MATQLTVYSDEIASAQRLAHNMRGHISGLHENIRKTEEGAERLQAALALSGVALENVVRYPGLGLELGSFAALGGGQSRIEVLQEAQLMVPEMEVVKSHSFETEVLDEISLPFVLKNWSAQRGERKYLVNRPEQLEKVRSSLRDPEFRFRRSAYIVEDYVEPPDGYAGTFRIMADATGTIMCASLLYREIDPNYKTMAPSLDEQDTFGNTRSPYYLASDEFRSNVARGGNLVPLNFDGSPEFDVQDFPGRREAFEAFGLNPSTDVCPPELIAYSKILAKTMGPHMALVLGFDFVADKAGKHPLLEINVIPGVLDYRLTRGLPDSMSDEEVYDLIYKEVGEHIAALKPFLGAS